MTDKKKKIIKELKEALDSLDITNKYRLNLIRAIEYLQEEPVSEKKCIFTKDSYTDEDRKALCDGCEEDCKYAQKEEYVSEDLEEAAKEHAVERFRTTRDEFLAEKCKWSFKAGAQWQKQQMMANAVEGVVHHFEKCKVASVHYNDPTGVPMAYFTSPEGLSAGDKVKIITIKKK